MKMKSGIIVSVVMVLFLLVELTVSLSSRTEWSALLELRSSMGIRGKEWPKKLIHVGTGPVLSAGTIKLLVSKWLG